MECCDTAAQIFEPLTIPPSSGSSFVKYKPNKVLNPGIVGFENSSTATVPPVFKTRKSSRNPSSTFARLRKPKAMLTASNESSRNGSFNASPSMKGIALAASFRAALSSIGRQKSTPTTRAFSDSNNVMAKSPVPQATSSTCDCAGKLTCNIRATFLRHLLSVFRDNR